MQLSDFDYDLPESLIALRPADRRDASRLLRVSANDTQHHHFHQLPDLLRPDDVLVVNDSRVIPAFLAGTRAARAQGGGGDVTIEVNLLEAVGGDAVWRALVRPAKRLTTGDVVTFAPDFAATVLSRDDAEVVFDFGTVGEAFWQGLVRAGQMPLPPYIARRRGRDETDKERYQTVYASNEGSVAAPTAGLHFTDELLSALTAKGIEIVRLTLHVGAGTFLPVTTDRIEEHRMHAERGIVSAEAAKQLTGAKAAGRRLVAVGTTSTRLLEAAATAPGVIEPFDDSTDIFITPGYAFKAVDALITNFHLPKSTLMMLISALMGRDRIMDAYQTAIDHGYRFYSYGDACLFEAASS